jgi:hypothetical protein
MVKDYNPASGEDPTIDIAEATAIKYEKVALMLVEPEMTADQLRDLPLGANDAIDEILDLLKDEEESLLDAEGN